MKIFVGGISGSGKSTLAGHLRNGGLHCVDDAFTPELSYWANKTTGERVPEPVDFNRPLDWKWDERTVRSLLGAAANRDLIICGNAANQHKFYSLFDRLYVLVADNDTLRRRLLGRTTNSFGKQPDELAWVLGENERLTHELLVAGAQAIDATQPEDAVVNDFLASLRA